MLNTIDVRALDGLIGLLVLRAGFPDPLECSDRRLVLAEGT